METLKEEIFFNSLHQWLNVFTLFYSSCLTYDYINILYPQDFNLQQTKLVLEKKKDIIVFSVSEKFNLNLYFEILKLLKQNEYEYLIFTNIIRKEISILAIKETFWEALYNEMCRP